MYYLFESQVEMEFDVILDSYRNEESTITPYADYSYTLSNGGSITYEGLFGTVNQSVFMTAAQTQKFYNKVTTETVSDVAQFILGLILSGPWGYFFSATALARVLIDKTSWRRVFNGSGRAHISTIYSDLEGQATVIYDWTTYPTANVYSVNKILEVKRSLDI